MSVEKGDLVAIISYLQVDRVENGVIYGKDCMSQVPVSLPENSGLEFYSANGYTDEVKCSRTDLVEVLQQVGVKPFTVNFLKKDGSTRTLRGIMSVEETGMGRSTVLDMELTPPEPRQVDHRTINWLIVNDVRYTVK